MQRTTTEPAPKRRRDRKDELAVAAAAMFYDRGYERVGIDDIAEAVGITGGAVYRHYANKAQLLARVFDDQLAHLFAALESQPEGGDPESRLQGLFDRLLSVFVDTRPLATLLERDARHLTDDDQRVLLERIELLTDRLATAIAEVRPDLDGTDTAVLARAVLALFGSHSFHVVPVSRAHAHQLLRQMMSTVVTIRSLPHAGAAPARAVATSPTGGQSLDLAALRSSRRERLLNSAITLFGRHGYAAIRMEDIGAAAGITGPAIYTHFGSKADLLVAALRRGGEWLALGVSSAFASSATAAEALARVVASYVHFLLEYPELITLLASEASSLSADQHSTLWRPFNEYAEQWASLLTAVRPDLDDRDALFVSWCVLTTINDGARSPRVRERGDAEQLLVDLAYEVLQLEGDN
jgi:AcrR family transcriptional regulator